MMDEDILKWNNQCPKLIQVLVMLILLSKYLSSPTTNSRYFHKILSGPEADKLLYLLIAIINYFLEKEFHDEYCLNESSSNKDLFTCWI